METVGFAATSLLYWPRRGDATGSMLHKAEMEASVAFSTQWERLPQATAANDATEFDLPHSSLQVSSGAFARRIVPSLGTFQFS